MKQWAAMLVVSTGFALVTGAASAETADEAKGRVQKQHDDCIAAHKGNPRAEAVCAQLAAQHEKELHSKSVSETKTLFGQKIEGAALTAAIELEKQLGKPLDHTLAIAAAKQVPDGTFRHDMDPKIKEAAAALEAKARPLVEPHAKELSESLAKWSKTEQERIHKVLEQYKDKLAKQTTPAKLTQAQIDHKVLTEKALLARQYEQRFLGELDRELHKYDTSLDAEINAKADEISTAEKTAWLAKVESGLGAQTKVKMADLASVRDRLWDRVATTHHHGHFMVRALLRAAVYKSLQADIRKQASA